MRQFHIAVAGLPHKRLSWHEFLLTSAHKHPAVGAGELDAVLPLAVAIRLTQWALGVSDLELPRQRPAIRPKLTCSQRTFTGSSDLCGAPPLRDVVVVGTQ